MVSGRCCVHTWELRLQLDGDLAHSEIRAERDVVEHLGALVGVDAHLRERLGRRLLDGRLGEDVHDGSTTAACSCVSSLRLRTEPPFLTSMDDRVKHHRGAVARVEAQLEVLHLGRRRQVERAPRISLLPRQRHPRLLGLGLRKSLCFAAVGTAGPEKQPEKHRRLIFS